MTFYAHYENGYCGCDEVEEIEVDSYEEAEEYAQENLYQYAESWTHVAFGWDTEYTEEEFEEYFENCSFYVSESEED